MELFFSAAAQVELDEALGYTVMGHEEMAPATAKPARLGRVDPLLQELWAIKAALDAQAGSCLSKRCGNGGASPKISFKE